MLVHRRVTPGIKFVVAHLYTWVERGTVRVKSLAKEHNTMSPARAQDRVKHNNQATTCGTLRIFSIVISVVEYAMPERYFPKFQIGVHHEGS